MGLTQAEKVKLNSKNIEEVRGIAKGLNLILTKREKDLSEIKTFNNRLRLLLKITGWVLFLGMAVYDVIASQATWAYNPGYEWKQVSVMVFGIVLVILGSKRK